MELPDGVEVPAEHLNRLLLSAMDALEQREREMDQRELEARWGLPAKPGSETEGRYSLSRNRNRPAPTETHTSLDELIAGDEPDEPDDFLFDASDASDTDPDADDDV